MKMNRDAIYVMTPLTILTLLVAIVFYCEEIDILYDIMLALFGGASLSLITAVINYRVEKKNCLERFFMESLKVRNNFARYKFSGNLNERVDIVLKICEFDYGALDFSFGSLSFLIKDKKNRKYIFENIYKPIQDMKRTLIETKFHLDIFKESAHPNDAVAQTYLDSLDNHFKKETITYSQDKSTKKSTIENRIVNNLDTELDYFYYNILYPRKKEKNNREKENG